MRYQYPAELGQDDEGRIVVSFPDVPEALTDGADRAQALAEAADALGAALAGYAAARREIPRPGPALDRPLVAVPAGVAAKLALISAMRRNGISNPELARRMGISETAVRRLVDPDHASRIEAIQAALAAVGCQIVVEAA